MELENDRRILTYLKEKENDKLSLLKGFDLSDMLFYLNCYYLELRDELHLSTNDTFGIEIECEEADDVTIDENIYELGLDHWQMVGEISVFNGIELVSPVLTDKKATWLELRDVCKILGDNAVIGRNAGGHVHIGTQVLGDSYTAWLNFLKLWGVYEHVIFRFLYGEFLMARPSLNKYAPPCNRIFLACYETLKKKWFKKIETVFNTIPYNKNSAVNFSKVFETGFSLDNTIEFRSPNGTLEPVVWQNNINLLVKLLNYCKSKHFNNDIVDRRRSLICDRNMVLGLYHHIYLEEALEFSDLIFNNNLDKIYFLRQYLKSFEVGNGAISLEECKCFVKKIHD